MSRKGCVVVSVIVVVIVLILLGCCLLCSLSSASFSDYDFESLSDSNYNYNELVSGGEDKIAVIDVEGVIMDVNESSDFWGSSYASSNQMINYLEEARKDTNVKAIILRMNTPGGDVYASDEVYKKIKEVQAQGKVVITQMKGLAASGGYYLAAPSDKIVASPITLTGSIGVRMDFQSLNGLYEKLGIDTRTITNSGADYKTGEGLFDDNPNGEEDKIYQSIVDEAYDRFVSIVVEGRKMKKSEVLEIADGRIFTGKQALDQGLVDKLGGFDEAVSTAEEEAGITNATVILYEEYDFWSMLAGYSSNFLNPSAQIAKLIDPTPGAKLRYLYVGE